MALFVKIVVTSWDFLITEIFLLFQNVFLKPPRYLTRLMFVTSDVHLFLVGPYMFADLKSQSEEH